MKEGYYDNEAKISLLDSGEMLVEPPKVYITIEAMEKIQCFTRLSSGEINGWGIVERENNNFTITDVLILEQEAGPGASSVEENPMALNKFIASCDEPSKLKFQWHSHVDMPPFFSPTDTGTIRSYSNDFMISFVINKKGNYRCRIDLFKPFYVGFEIPVLVILPTEQNLIQYCRKEIEQKVKQTGLTRFLPKKIQKVLGKEKTTDWDSKEDPASALLENVKIQENEEMEIEERIKIEEENESVEVDKETGIIDEEIDNNEENFTQEEEKTDDNVAKKGVNDNGENPKDRKLSETT